MSTAALDHLKSLHFTQSTKERSKFYKHNDKALTGGKRMNVYRYLSVIMDGMDQAKTRLPHWDRPPKYMDDKRQVDLHLMGALVSAYGIGEDHKGTECMVHWNVKQSFKDDSNATCTMLEDVIKRVQTARSTRNKALPEVLYIQLDNVGTNKNHWLLGYACWLVQEGIFLKVKINYLLVGHTHENIDQFFSRLSVSLQSQRAFTLDQMMDVVKTCSTPMPVQHVVTEMTDVKTWLDAANVGGSHNIKKSHIFRIKKNEDGVAVVQSKQYSTSAFYGEELRMLPGAVGGVRYKVFPRPFPGPPVAAPGGKQEKSILQMLRETKRLLELHEPDGWDESSSEWWQTFLDDLDSHHVRPHPIQCEDHGLLTCTMTPLETPPTIEDETLHPDEVELVLPTFRDLSSRPTSSSFNARRCADPKDMVVGQMVCLKPEAGQGEVANINRTADLVTPVWIGKILELVNAKEIRIHWFGADFASSVATSSASVDMNSEETYGRFRWTPRFQEGRTSVPNSSVVDRYQCGLLAYAFQLKKSNPTHSLPKAAIKLIRERLADSERENALEAEDLV